MTVDLFAGVAVSDLPRAIEWYSRLFGAVPAFLPNDDEAVWELAGERHLFLERRPEHAGHARHLLFVDDLAERIADAGRRGVHPSTDEMPTADVRKVGFVDPDGNEFGLAGAWPATRSEAMITPSGPTDVSR